DGAAGGASGSLGTTDAPLSTDVPGQTDASATGDAPGAHDAPGTTDVVSPAERTATDANTSTGPVTVESLQVVGTHNSYHQAPPIAFDASHKYTHKPLDQQLSGGVRSLELDVHMGTSGYEVYHIALIDPNSSCRTLDECLGIIATWSNGHPTHVPIFLWLEIKDDTGGSPITDIVPVEQAVEKALTRDKMMTPAWLRGSYASPRERLMTVGWPTLEQARGKIMVTLINRDARTKAYAHDGTSLDDRLMWVNAAPTEFGLPWAAITKDIEPADQIASAHAGHLLLGINVCAINLTDDACTARMHQFVDAGIQALDDDLPFQIAGRNYWLQLPKGSPGCNPVTAPAACATTKLE
ncbi:MAG TPA: Ca2+-dependent phosphoinositide-specific phospholipase C, partial [Polyangia bacterium]|nr:Ca2+-dependent phosphoinositide-specific phospholipase C [Polyangia bacterium]